MEHESWKEFVSDLRLGLLSRFEKGERHEESSSYSFAAEVEPVSSVQPQGPVLVPPGTAPFPQPVSASEQQLAAQVVQVQSQQISELVQLLSRASEKCRPHRLQEELQRVPHPLQVESSADGGRHRGVRHNKAENYLAKIPNLNHEKMGTRAGGIATWAEYDTTLSAQQAIQGYRMPDP